MIYKISDLATLILICMPFISLSEELKKVKFEDAVYVLDTAAVDKKSEEKLKKHNAIFDKICKGYCDSVNPRALVKTKIADDTIKVSYHKGLKVYVYKDLERYGIKQIYIDENDFPKSIYFSTPHPRRPSLEEMRNPSKISPTYCNISESSAVAKARMVLESVYGAEEAGYFEVAEIPQTSSEYCVTFKTMTKNDISDCRSATVIVNANTGFVDHFTGDGRRDPDFTYDYIPKVSKSQALQMYENERLRLGADIEINEVILLIGKKHGKTGEKCWAWHIYGFRKDIEMTTSAYMFIDSETGEVLAKKLE
jgi:hypothetical protein